MNDKSIIELFQKRNEQAIAELKLKYDRLCYHIAGTILSQRQDIEECINSAYYDIWSKIPPEEPDDLKTYLCRIVKNKAIDKLKYNSAAKRGPQLSVSLDELAECIPDRQQDDMSAQKLAEVISRFLRTQDERHRKIFVRRYWYGDSLSKIAEYFSMNEKTVATYLFRTRKKLKDFLKKEGFKHE
ncbi:MULTISPECIES: RNA polymerase sigma factor [Ruminococcus]|uniref:RNA polymerase sigma-70 factor, ECF subfamily n=1 Tax=Ruminococcus flavefaciens TaxID=1265 RepID=A0A1M7K1Y4_RUMFL|nr:MULTISPECIES: sigma-70 family RNA polymerase sigma factor [Ruminococcus]MCR4795139.1 sigma-70 family RNA polymerase sigma factor [Ruminococcus sp.]SHM59286.1 RNA polymerase sigma-70 factor, ECF subfamily [Ruminococcus flavefaciens]